MAVEITEIVKLIRKIRGLHVSMLDNIPDVPTDRVTRARYVKQFSSFFIDTNKKEKEKNSTIVEK